jgi:DNA-binding NarL/FixJ family response regulator
MSVKIILADDHQLMREGLRTLIEKELGMEVVGEAGDGQAVVQLARETLPDIIIMDVGMPGLDGIDATRQITSEFPSVKVVALSMHSNKLFVMDMFEAGASGYLLKECAFAELATAIDAVRVNEVYLSPKVAGIVLDGHMKRPSAEPNSTVVLTEKECEVLQLLATGKSTKQIALQFEKSVQTIDAHRRRIMDKLGIDNLAELVKYAIREGLTTLEF